jgi:predicted RNA-binding protein with PUA-like domain
MELTKELLRPSYRSGHALSENLHKRQAPVYSVRPTRMRQNPRIVEDARLTTATTRPAVKRGHWLFSVNPQQYHWDTLFVKGKEMWRGAGSRADALRALKQVRRGDRVLCYHAAPERALYAIAEVTRDPYPDPHDLESKMLVADLRAMERLPRQVPLNELRNNPALRKVKFLKNVRLIISAITDEEYQEILRMAGIVASPGLPLP